MADEKLRLSERKGALSVGQSLSRSAAGRQVLRIAQGSSSPVWRSAEWFSEDVKPDTISTVSVNGDPNAPILRRFWRMAAIVTTPIKDLSELKEQYENSTRDAVAYIAEDALHVGVRATEGRLFANLDDNDLGVAMRLGRGPLVASMGLWLPGERHFVSASRVGALEPPVYVSSLPHEFPGVLVL